MSNDATQPGVPNTDNAKNDEDLQSDQQPREPSARELAMEAIASGHNERVAAELAPENEPESDPAQPADQLTAQLEADNPPTPQSLDQMMVRVKIDGVERDVSVAEMQRQYQKNGAAERRLEEATRLLSEARAAIPPVGFDATTPRGDSASSASQPSDGEEARKDLLSALFEGDEERALKAMETIGIGRQTPTQDASQLAAQLTPAIKQQLVVEDALERFAVSHADIVNDPYLADLADRYLAQEMDGGKPFTQALDAAGKRTRDWLTSKGVKAPESEPTINRNTKLERKAGIDLIPALNSKATMAEDPVQSATDVIAEMRKARGLEA